MLGDFIILYGSQTGQSKAIAEIIVAKAEKANLSPRIHCMSTTEKDFFIERETVAVIILSTTGDGDHPDTAAKFCRRLYRKTLPQNFLEKLSFALLGLGDTNYNNFCASPKRLEKRLLELSAKPFYATVYCDDAVGTDTTAEPWIENLLPTLYRYLIHEDIQLDDTMEYSHKLILEKAPQKPTSSTDETITDEFKSKLNLDREQLSSPTEDLDSNKIQFGLKCGSISGHTELKIPLASAPYLTVEYSDEVFECSSLSLSDLQQWSLPSQGSPVFQTNLIYRKQLTDTGATKQKFEVVFDFKDAPVYEPGDAFYFIIPNSPFDIELFLQRLKIGSLTDKKCTIKLLENTTRKNAKIPPYLQFAGSLRHILQNFVDIRKFPSKAVLRILADSCDDAKETRRLLELCSVQGGDEYRKFICEPNLSILDLLNAFQSSHPPIERLLEHLPALQPRPYSVACVDKVEERKATFAYSLVRIPAENFRFQEKLGLATSYLTNSDVGRPFYSYLKKPGRFRLTNDHRDMSLIMVGPGTGVAPFLGFLEFIKNTRDERKDSFPQTWLFFGCRNENLDYIYRKDLEHYASSNILTHLTVAFSRDGNDNSARYVQDNILRYGKELCDMILSNDRLKIFVCGDEKFMAANVFEAFCHIIVQHGDKQAAEAASLLRNMQTSEKYLQDIWT